MQTKVSGPVIITPSPVRRPIQWYVSTARDRWGSPIENRKLLYPFGIAPLDQALRGINLIDGDLAIIQAEEKMRKTTFAANVAINGQLWVSEMQRKGVDVVRPLVVVDMLEPGMKAERYFDTLVAMVATRYLIQQGHQPDKSIVCPVCRDGECRETVLDSKYLRFNTRTETQERAINAALEEMETWSMHIYGPTDEEGDTTNFEASITGTRDQKSRWVQLCEEYGKVVFVTDHIQQYVINGVSDDYGKQIAVVPALSNIVAKYNAAVFALTQVSLTSIRNATQGTESKTAAGGRKAAQAANTIFGTDYEDGSPKMMITVERSRDAGSFSVWQQLDITSGIFYGDPKRVAKAEFRPGQRQANGGK